MKKEKTILFYCTSVYQMLIFLIMTELRYKQYRNIVILDENLSKKMKLEYAGEYFDEVIILSQKASEYEIESKLANIMSTNEVIQFAFSTWGAYGGKIYDLIPSPIPVVLLDEGASTCEYKKFMSYVKKDIDFSKINEIWLMDPNISQNDKTVPEYKIPLEEICNDIERFRLFLSVVNKVFNYKNVPIEGDTLFFDRYLVQLGRIPVKYERFVLESLQDMLGNAKLAVKLHPFENREIAKWRYRNMNVSFFEQAEIPWELVVLNYMYTFQADGVRNGFPKLLMATNTTTLFTTQSLLRTIDWDVSVIYINKIVSHLQHDMENVATKTLECYKDIYPDRPLYLPSNWTELYENICLCLSENKYDSHMVSGILEKERTLFLEEYAKTLRTSGNLLQTVHAEFEWTGTGGNKEEQICNSYIVGGEKEYIVGFSDFSVCCNSDIKGRICPAGIPPVYANGVLKKVMYYRNGEQCEIIYNSAFRISNKKPYFEICIENKSDIISGIEVHYQQERVYQLFHEVEQEVRFKNYYEILIKWIRRLQKGRTFEAFCEKKIYKYIGIYGNGVIGQLLQEQLKNCGMETLIIDRKEYEGVISVKDMDSYIEKLDLIIVTPMFDFYNIHKLFGFDENVIGLDDFLEMMEDV